ncbi:MAG: PilW family protein, partial [Thermoanaerobaculia bacterium]|nr:PilW family protein [Thermoanaerobaculia bacterium]
VAVRNNVDPISHIAVGDTDSPEVLSGTDVLTVRGVFTNPLYQFNPTAGAYSVIGDPPTSGTLVISDKTPTGIPQNLEPFRDIIDRTEFKPEALLVVSPLDDALYAVVKLNNSSSYTEESGVITQVSLAFDISCGTYCNEFNAISAGGSYPSTMTTAAFAGILEEYRYYIREVREIPGDDSSRLSPRLSRARFYPGTEVAYLEDDSNFQADVADNILDLQVALGIDSAPTIDDVILESDPPDADDDWLFNSPADDSTDTDKWVGTAPDFTKLFYVRINTLARTDRQARGTEADLLDLVEDKDYSVAPGLEYNTGDQRAFRRRWMQTVIDMRNVS